jgi:hypothetical protein
MLRKRVFAGAITVLLYACATGDETDPSADPAGGACADCDASAVVRDAATAVDTGARDTGAARDVSLLDVDVPDATADAASGLGCADGTREGLLDAVTFPDVAACSGAWVGDVSNAVALCAGGWRPCVGGDLALSRIAYTDATAFGGCYAMNAAQDDEKCHPGSCTDSVNNGVDSAKDIDMGAVGGDCKWKFATHKSCLKSGRIDASENSGTGCNWYAGLSGVLCCRG